MTFTRIIKNKPHWLFAEQTYNPNFKAEILI